ncbi:UbiA family prenyltransferase [Aerosakkonema sp. BLCC-F183]|uniref:UbiA family prenyltransferase n=1 Tax=Aerosakkonema sp. BLCC-F183 TaxID=3342834 RepID=UPI0035BAE7B1
MSVKATVLSSLLALSKKIYRSLRHEVCLSWQFISGDISASIVPGLLFMMAAWKTHPTNAVDFLMVLGRGIVYFWLYIVPFCISNQIVGIEEDRINKPHRPLVKGSVSLLGAKVRLVVSMVLFGLVGWWFGVLEWALLWQGCIFLHNLGSGSKHWITKNLFMGEGALAQLAAAWQLVTPITSIAWQWILVVAGVWLFLAAIQDLRDIDGDRAIGRNTFPIAFGETTSRVVLTSGFGLLPFVIHFALMVPAGLTWNVILCDIVLAVISFTIAARIVSFRLPKADHYSYMLFTYWFCSVLVCAIAVI